MDLPDGLDLPLSTGAPWWYWLGGRPALDLDNTLRERWNRRVETLVTPADLAAWLVRAGLLDAPLPVTPALLAEARALRETIDTCVLAVLAGEAPAAADLARIDRLLDLAATRPHLRPGPDGLPVLAPRGADASARRALARVALDAAELLADPAQRARLRICASETCSARFYDRSPAGRRRWCSMEACGNVAKARRHRARARS